ncbi:NAD(+) kinase [Candidatus Rariloculus sp.]|uniref:NAD(+) kinase n=1 Tax=Candidatus Rariloculus sp. TaxID=3101265 RepID=UPI003D126234
MTREFAKIGLWGRLSEPTVAEPAREISAHLVQSGLEVFGTSSSAAGTTLPGVTEIPDDEFGAAIDLLITVGGDGTLLRSARQIAGKNVPLIGINRGRLGFLTDVSPDHMLKAIDTILAGDYLAEERRLLEARIVRDGQCHGTMFALNDVVLQRSEHMLYFRTTVDGSFVSALAGDGLIVATPTGSTAYALACGGPIIQPDVDAVVLVPICPHSLSDRPLVLKSSSVIEVRTESSSGYPPHIACDGEQFGELVVGDTLRIAAASETVTLLHPTNYSYYELLRSKLHWGLPNRPGNTLSTERA